ncbi:MAG: prepilin peptidase [Candidatus Omnitrophica bacterium]|nr:prepilin peptidase [Candidatus Omnitrophota bacterium]
MNELEIILRIFFFAFGSAIGSFLNVCIVRLPQGKSVVMPGSHCMKCDKLVRWFDNIPILSYFLLRGKCRDCGTVFSFRYAGIEFLTGIIFLGLYLFFGLSWTLIPWFFLVGSLIIATFVDLELRIIPDELSLWGIPVGLVMSFFLPQIQSMAGSPLLGIGLALCAIFSVLALLLMLLDAWGRRSFLAKEDVWLIGSVFVAVLFQFLLTIFVVPDARAVRILGLVASCQGVIVGGGALYLLGLVGAILIKKRVVTLIDLKSVTDRYEDLFKELMNKGYLDDEGEIQPKFSLVKLEEGFVLDSSWDKEREKVYALILDCQEGGVMGGGDVKLMALVGAFLGWKLALLTIVLAPFLGIPFAIVEKIRTKSSAIAFGPYLAVAAVVSLLFGEKLIAWILSGYGMY